MKTPIDSIKSKYESHIAHLSAIEDAIVKQFSIPERQRGQVRAAVREAYSVGRNTITTDDWCEFFG